MMGRSRVSVFLKEEKAVKILSKVASEEELGSGFCRGLVEKIPQRQIHFQRLSCQCRRRFLALVDAFVLERSSEAHQTRVLLKEIFDREVPYYTVEGGASLARVRSCARN